MSFLPSIPFIFKYPINFAKVIKNFQIIPIEFLKNCQRILIKFPKNSQMISIEFPNNIDRIPTEFWQKSHNRSDARMHSYKTLFIEVSYKISPPYLSSNCWNLLSSKALFKTFHKSFFNLMRLIFLSSTGSFNCKYNICHWAQD